MNIILKRSGNNGLSNADITAALLKSIEGRTLKRVLIIPPDFTRYQSNTDFITNSYYYLLTQRNIAVDILPALGTHDPMTPSQCAEMYSDIPLDRFLVHSWQNNVVKLGEVPGEHIGKITGGLWHKSVSCEISRHVMNPKYDLIISLGQVVPHEVLGMSNHSKNLFIGVGGSDMINKSHMIGAVYGMERIMGHDHTPVRNILDYCLEKFLVQRQLLFVLAVTTATFDKVLTHGLFIGDEHNVLEEAIAMSRKKNIDRVSKPLKKCVVYLDPKEYKSTWLGNKAIYRTRMAIAGGGELLVLAPGVDKFGDDVVVDGLIRKYGYCGRMNVLELFEENQDLRENMSVAAHLINGSSDGRFSITYAVRSAFRKEIDKVCFNSANFNDTIAKYDPVKLVSGWNIMPGGEEIFFIPNPSSGLWMDEKHDLT